MLRKTSLIYIYYLTLFFHTVDQFLLDLALLFLFFYRLLSIKHTFFIMTCLNNKNMYFNQLIAFINFKTELVIFLIINHFKKQLVCCLKKLKKIKT